MSTRPALIALLLTLLLAVGAYFVLKPPASTSGNTGIIAQGERVLKLDASAAGLKSITLTNPPALPQVLDRGDDGAWTWRANAASKTRYALDETAMRMFMRKFAEAKGVATPAGGKPMGGQPAPVALTFTTVGAGGGDTTLRLSPRALGGQVLAEVTSPDAPTPRAAIVADELLTVLTSPGPSAWRDKRALPADTTAAARITFTDGTGAKGFGLARREGQWYVTPPAPSTAPADSESVIAAIRTIDSLTISRFYDDQAQPTRQAAGFDKPSAILTLEFDDRAIDAATQKAVTSTRTYRLLIGQPGDSAGTTLYATPDDGATIFAVVAEPLTRLLGPASDLVMRNATRTLPADIGTIEIKGEGERRTVRLTRDGVTGRWSETLDTAEPVVQSPTEATASESILTFLTRSPAESIAFQPPLPPPPAIAPPSPPARATITLLTPGGQPLDRFEVFTSSTASGAGGANGLTIRTAGIDRTYSKPPEQLIKWIATLSR